jgi:hypothetical protein
VILIEGERIKAIGQIARFVGHARSFIH